MSVKLETTPYQSCEPAWRRNPVFTESQVNMAQESRVYRKPGVHAARTLDPDDMARERLAAAHRELRRTLVRQERRAVRVHARQERSEPGRSDQLGERHAQEALGRLVAGDDVQAAVVDEDALVRRVDDRAPALLVVAQRALGSGARRDVDYGADEPGDLTLRVAVGRLVVDRVAQAPVARAHADLVALRPTARIELAVHGGVLLGDRRVAGIEVGDVLADETLCGNAEELLPGAVDAEIAAVAALEEHRHREGIDEPEGRVERCCRLLLPACPL